MKTIRLPGIIYPGVLLLSVYLPNTASATCTETPSNSGHWECTGTVSDTVPPDGFQIDSTADIEILQTDGSITGTGTNGSGIVVTKANNSGTTEITINGDVTGNELNGIQVKTSDTSATTIGDIDIVQHSGSTITGMGDNGITIQDFYNTSASDISITTGGTVRGLGQTGSGYASAGVNTTRLSSTGSITITQEAGTESIIYGNYVGISAYSSAGSNIRIETAGEISTSDYYSSSASLNSGIYTFNYGYANAASSITVAQTDGSISGYIYGIYALNILGASTDITTAGTVESRTGSGIYASSSALSINQTAGSITGQTYGIEAYNAGTGTTSISTAGTVAGVTGGIYSESQNGYAVDIAAGNVSASAPANGTLHIIDATGGTVDIASAATVTAADAADIVLRDGDQDNDSIDEIGGAMTVISAGSVTGSAILGQGDDSFTLTGGNWDGDIYTDDKTASASDGNDNITWSGGTLSGGIYAQNGSDIAAVSSTEYDGSQILDGGDDTSTADGWIDTLTFSDITATTTGATILNWEKITLDGSTMTVTGTWAVGDGSADTGIFLEESTLIGGSAVTIDGNLSLDSTSTLIGKGNGTGVYTITHNLTNSGTIDTRDNAVGDVVNVGGNYQGNGVIAFDVDFSTATSDKLSVTGTVTADATIIINDLRVISQDSKGEITLIETADDSDKSDEIFIFAQANQYRGNTDLGRFSSSPYIWQLTTSGNNWILGNAYVIPTATTPSSVTADVTTKPAVISEIPAYVSLPTFSYEILVNKLDSLHQRMGELRNHTAWASLDPSLSNLQGLSAVDFDEQKLNGWIKTLYSGFDFDDTENFSVNGKFGITELGFDRKFLPGRANALYLGAYASFTYGDFENDGTGAEYGSLYAAETDINGRSGGIYGTWFSTGGSYIDTTFDYMKLNADIEAVEAYSTDGTMIGGSIEAGHTFVIRPGLILEPQAQVKIAHIEWDDFYDGWNTVQFSDHTYITGRTGIRGEYTIIRRAGSEFKPWLYLGVQHEFTDGMDIIYCSTIFPSHQYETTANLQAGITADMSQMLQFYGDLGYTTDFSGYSAWRIDGGLRLKW